MNEMTHDRCSELLSDLLAGDLSADEALEVETHLESCADCRAEMKSLMALAGELTPLTDFERAHIRRAVVKAVLPEEKSFGPEDRGFWSKAAPYLSAAAALLILGFAITSIDLGGSDEMGDASTAGGSTESLQDDTAGGGDEAASGGGRVLSGDAEDQAALESGAPQDAAAGEPEAAAGGGSDGTTAGGSEFATESSNTSGIPVFITEEELGIKGLKAQTDDRQPYRSTARSYDPENADADRDRLIKTLARRADRSGRSGEALETCIRSVRDLRSLPVLAHYGTLKGNESLAVGYVLATGGTYDRYLIAIWTPPTECGSPRFVRGQLR